MTNEQKDEKQTLKTEIAVRNKINANMMNFFNTLPDPDEVLKKEGKDISIYRQLLNDPHVYSVIQSRKAGVMAKEWAINRGIAETKESQIIEEQYKKLKIDKIIRQMLNAPLFGMQVHEVIWDDVNGYILPVELKEKPIEWFSFDLEGNLVLKKSYNETEQLPPKKFLVTKHDDSELNPYGDRVLAKCFWSVAFKKGGVKFWLLFTEKYGMPTTVITVRDGSDEEEIASLAIKAQSMVQDGVMVVTEGTLVNILESTDKAASADIYLKLVEHCESNISKAVLGQTLTTQLTGSNGSFAASKTHQEVRGDIVDSDSKLVEESFNTLNQWIYELNFKKDATVPEFTLYNPKDVSKELADRDKVLCDIGIKFNKQYFIEEYELKAEHFELIEDKTTLNKTKSEFSKTETPQTAIDNFNPDNEKDAEIMLKALFAYFNNCKNYNDAINSLAELYPNLNTNQLEEKISKAIFVSETLGIAENAK